MDRLRRAWRELRRPTPSYRELDIGLWPRENLGRRLDRIATALEHIDGKMVKRRPRIIYCRHPELHPDEEIG